MADEMLDKLLPYVLIGGVAIYLLKDWNLSGGLTKTTDAVGSVASDTATLYGRGAETLGSFWDVGNALFDKWTRNINNSEKDFITQTQIGTTPNGAPVKVATTSTGQKLDVLPPGTYNYVAPPTNYKSPTSYKSAGGSISSVNFNTPILSTTKPSLTVTAAQAAYNAAAPMALKKQTTTTPALKTQLSSYGF